MSSTATQSQSVSFTVADIGKVIDCFAADLDMNAQSTGLLGWEAARQSAEDVSSWRRRGTSWKQTSCLRTRPEPSSGPEVRGRNECGHAHCAAAGKQSVAAHARRAALRGRALQPDLAEPDRHPESGLRQNVKYQLVGSEHGSVLP